MEFREYAALLDHPVDVPEGSIAVIEVGDARIELAVEAGLGPWGLRIRGQADDRNLLAMLLLPDGFAEGSATLSTLTGTALLTQGFAVRLESRLFVGKTETAHIDAVTDEHIIGRFEATVCERSFPAPPRGMMPEQLLEAHALDGAKQSEQRVQLGGTFHAHRARWASDEMLSRIRAHGATERRAGGRLKRLVTRMFRRGS